MGKHLVFIDPGHGGSDPGALGNGLQEKDLTLAIALKVGSILKQHDLQVGYSRTTDTYVSLEDRAKLANRSNADIFVSIHINSAKNTLARGILNYLGMAYKEEQNTTSKDQPSAWAKEAWEWGWKNKIVDGTRPKDGATREELITMLYKYHANVNYPRL